jgi:WD40 repeat protein
VGHTKTVNSVAFHPNGNLLVSGSADLSVRLWDVESGKLVHTFAGNSAAINAVAFHPGGKLVAAGSDDFHVWIWDVEERKSIRRLLGHMQRVTSLAFNPDGSLLATGSADNTAKVWETATGRELQVLRGHNGPVKAVAFGFAGQRLATASSDNTIRIGSAPFSGPPIVLYGTTAGVQALHFASDGNRLFGATADGCVRVWNPYGSESTRKGVCDPSVFAIRVRADLTAAMYSALPMRFNVLPTRQQPNPVPTAAPPFAVAAALASSGAFLAVTPKTGPLQVRDLRDGATCTIERPAGTLHTQAVSQDGRTQAVAAGDLVHVLSVDTRRRLHQFSGPPQGIAALAFSPDGKHLVGAARDHVVRMWNVHSGTLEWQREGGADHGGGGIAFSSAGKLIAVPGSTDHVIHLWHADSGAPHAVLRGHTAPVRALAYGPDDRRLASGSDDKTIRIWATDSGQPC